MEDGLVLCRAGRGEDSHLKGIPEVTLGFGPGRWQTNKDGATEDWGRRGLIADWSPFLLQKKTPFTQCTTWTHHCADESSWHGMPAWAAYCRKCCFIYMLKGTTSELRAADKQQWCGRRRKGKVRHSWRRKGWEGVKRRRTSKEVFIICRYRGAKCRSLLQTLQRVQNHFNF